MRPPFPSSCGRVRGSLKSRRLRSAPVYQGFPEHGDRSPDGCDRASQRGLQLQRSLAPIPPTLLSTDPRFAALYPLATQAILSEAAFVCSTIDSSTSRSWSLPKNISLPTKNVGEPKLPRGTASAGVSVSFFLSSSCWARE